MERNLVITTNLNRDQKSLIAPAFLFKIMYQSSGRITNRTFKKNKFIHKPKTK